MERESVRRCIEEIRRIAREMGYAIGEHGSKQRDLDLIAVPWVEDAASPLDLIFRLCEELHFDRGEIENKPHGRTGFSLLGGEMPLQYVDLSVIWPKESAAGGALSRGGS